MDPASENVDPNASCAPPVVPQKQALAVAADGDVSSPAVTVEPTGADGADGLSSRSSSVKSTSERSVSLIFQRSPTGASKPAPASPTDAAAGDGQPATPTAGDAPPAGALVARPPQPVATPAPAGTHTCRDCNAPFASARMRSLHERVAHEHQPCHVCPHCRGIFGHVSDLNAHILSSHRGPAYAHACGDCGVRFATRAQLRLHVAVHRRAGPMVRCSRCPFRAARRADVRWHMADRHGVWGDGVADGEPRAIRSEEFAPDVLAGRV